MFKLLFQGVEQWFGPALPTVAALTFWAGMVTLFLAVLSPFYRRVMEYAAQRIGMAKHWVMTCPFCGKQTLVNGPDCGYCGERLVIPRSLKFWTAATRTRPGTVIAKTQWMTHLAGNSAFLVLSVALLAALGILGQQAEVHRLFLGCTLLAWAAVGWLGGKALRLDRPRTLTRVRDGVAALAALGVMAASLALATQASAEGETVLARFSVAGGSARIEGEKLPLRSGTIGFEYVQLEHKRLGFRQVVGLAFLGRERMSVCRCPLKQPVLNHLRAHANSYAKRGLTVRLRTDRLRVTSGRSYEVVGRQNQVLMRQQRQITASRGHT